jgi:uncharacterized phiE125 gp8 family phage protein
VALYLESAPAAEPVTVAELKRQCRIDIADEDMDLLTWIAAAREQVEQDTDLQLVASAWRLALDGFPDGAIELPKGPVTAVISVTYRDADGLAQTFDAALYQVVADGEGAQVRPAVDTAWPATDAAAESVQVTFAAGWPVTSLAATIAAGVRTVTPASMAGLQAGQRLLIDGDRAAAEQVTVQSTTSTTFTALFANDHAAAPIPVNGVPQRARQAVRLLAGHWYLNREATVTGSVSGPIDLAYRALVDGLRVWKLE